MIINDHTKVYDVDEKKYKEYYKRNGDICIG